MRKFIYILLLCALVLPAGRSFAQSQEQMIPLATPAWLDVRSSELTRDSILVGEQVVWNTVFAMPEHRELHFAPYADVVKGENAPVDVIHDYKLDTLSVKNGIREIRARILLTSFDSGYYKLPLMVALTPEGDTIYLDSPFLDVTNIQIDTAKFVMHDIKGQMRYPITLAEVLPWIGGALALALLVWLLARYIKARREKGGLFGKQVPDDPPHIVALRELEKIRGEKLWQSGKEKQFYTGVTDTLREYIEARYGVSAMEQTSAEIMQSLSDKSVEEKAYRELGELFNVADLVKFAKYVPATNENEEAIPVAVRFVNSTFMQEMEEDKQKGEE